MSSVDFHLPEKRISEVLDVELLTLCENHISELTWRKLTEPKGVWICCICGSSVSNICWIRDSLLSNGLCHDTWSPLQNVFSVEEKTRGDYFYKYYKIFSLKFPGIHTVINVSIWRYRIANVTITGKGGTRERRIKSKCGKKTRKTQKTAFPSEESAWEVTPTQSRFAAGEKQRERGPGISIHLTQGPSPPKRKLTPAGEQRRTGWWGEGSLGEKPSSITPWLLNAPFLLIHTLLYTLYMQLMDFMNLAAQYRSISVAHTECTFIHYKNSLVSPFLKTLLLQ